MATIERRLTNLTDLGLEQRDEDGGVEFRGHPAVFNELTDLGPFREKVAPGAFKRTIGEGRANVAFLYNHNPDTIMAHSRNGTLDLSEDDRGLFSKADLDPSDVDVQRLLPKLRSGNVAKMSFGFRAINEDDSWWDHDPEDGGKPIRTLREVELFDVSPVTFPAYSGTDAALRTIADGTREIAESRGIDCDVDDVVAALRESNDLQVSDDTDEVSKEKQDRKTPDAPAPEETPGPAPARLAVARKRLDYLQQVI